MDGDAAELRRSCGDAARLFRSVEATNRKTQRPTYREHGHRVRKPPTIYGLRIVLLGMRYKRTKTRPSEPRLSSEHNLITRKSKKSIPLSKKLPTWHPRPSLSRLAFPLQRLFTEPPIPKSRPRDPSSLRRGKRCLSLVATRALDSRSQELSPRPAQRE